MYVSPLERAKIIKNEFKEYLMSSVFVDDKELRKLLIDGINNMDIMKGPYLSINKPFKSSYSIEYLIENGLLSKRFGQLSSIDLQMQLYQHQYNALNLLSSGENAVITTGTGSGKTESFLFPIINDILNDLDNGVQSKGIKAVFLYPMNALVNDQLIRLREILKDYPEITFGSFTGDTLHTVEDVRNADSREKADFDAEGDLFIPYPENEIRSRDEMRENPPMLLFTNYSMLEYILIRPHDQKIFVKQNTKNWKYIVMDEAHVYTGSKGIELSHLLRRLVGKFTNGKVQYALTSATLGKGEESISEIIDFASSLTNSSYTKENIVFSDRIEYPKYGKYTLEVEDINKIYRNIESEQYEEILASIANKYNVEATDDVNETIYNLLLNDNIFLYIANYKNIILFSEIYNDLYNEFDLSMETFVKYINLISLAESNRRGLLDYKYHVFIRTPFGAFAVFKPNLKVAFNRTKTIDDLKAYELGTCKFCSSTYYIGHIAQNSNKFIQNDEVDIYENYGDSEKSKELKNIDFLLVNRNHIDVNSEEVVEYILCQKCGHLKRIKNVNSIDCECSRNYKFSVYHVEEKKRMPNNIKKCPICEQKSRSGVVRAFHIQKDEATSLLGQMNLQTMSGEKPKQFIAFSDSVQQASFYAKFLELNHLRFLRKRLILKMLELDDSLSFKELTGEMEEYIQRRKIINAEGDLEEAYKTEAWIATLSELLKVDGQFSGEGLGLFGFRLKKLKKGIINEFLTEGYYQELSQFNIDEIIALIHEALDVFRMAPAIAYKKHELDKDKLEDELAYRSYNNTVVKVQVVEKELRESNSVRSFMPSGTTRKKIKSNKLISYLTRVLNNNADCARNLAEEIWRFCEKLNIFESLPDAKYKKQINVSNYNVISGKNLTWYICEKCGKLTLNNVRNTCIGYGCTGKLKTYNEGKEVSNIGSFYKKQYQNKVIERLIVEEHTSQLGKIKGKKFQKKFKKKEINVLSSSTTFEMGIDIGSLDDVFLRNVPPTPSNYSQRAGRAGRRNSNEAFVLTYCGFSSHDFTYFSNPEDMIKGVVRPPYFDISNKKIVMRHIMAAALGMFFSKNEELYVNTIGEFLNNKIVDKFIDYVKDNPIELEDYITNAILSDLFMDSIHSGWINEITNDDSSINKMCRTIEDEINKLEEEKKLLLKDGSSNATRMATNINYQIDRIKDGQLISTLTSYIVIPKYGFPVDVVNLEISKDFASFKTKDNSSPSRDLGIAISEFAPESEIFIDKKKYTSRYIKFPTGEFKKLESRFYFECTNCNALVTDYTQTSEKMDACPICGTERGTMNRYIVPSYGFATESKPLKTTRLKPKKTFAGETKYIGNGVSNHDKYLLTKYLSVESSKNDELISLNKSPFFICEKCGYAEIDKKNANRPSKRAKKTHKNKNGRECLQKNLEKHHLAHNFRTDVLKLSFDSSNKLTKEGSLSTLYAILNAISYVFNIERRDINGLIHQSNGTQIILFDQVPGGAGHVKRIMRKANVVTVLEAAVYLLEKDCCEENTSCYSCLRNYQNQKVHEHLKRGLAIKVIKGVLNDINDFQEELFDTPPERISKNIKIIKLGMDISGRDYDYIVEDLQISKEDKIICIDFLRKKNNINDKIYYMSDVEINGEKYAVDAINNTNKIIYLFDDVDIDNTYSDWEVVTLDKIMKG
ncbi:DEAD/DEAH box helicase [Mycoplasmatota bacterium]|nr:DEAD/DEAH box helicase [Mycoplasmatota bacterium]